MSRWGSARGSNAHASSPFGDADDVESVSSKAPSRSAGVTPNHFQNLRLMTAKLAPDATSKQVAWYEIEVTTIDTVWTVVKRFSDCSVLCSSLEKLKLDSFSNVAGISFPSFPSKFHLGKQTPQFLERRRLQLEQYFQQLLLYLQKLSIAAVGERTAPPYAKVLRAGFSMLCDFVRRNSTTEAVVEEQPVSDPLIMQSRRDLLGGGPNMSSSSNQPKVRCIRTPKRFTIAVFLPGVLLKNIYVDTTDLGDRVVTVGGCWNEGIFSIEDVRDDAARSPRAGGSNQTSGVGDASTTTGGQLLSDTLPTGTFEMLYEVPVPFERCHWFSEYEAGVLFLHWDHP